jgi:acetyl-CoA acetyltransferase
MALKDTAIVGYAETKIVTRSPRDVFELAAEVVNAIIVRTGTDKAEIDGLVVNSALAGAGEPFWSQTMADYLGFELNFCQSLDIGGSSALGAVARAAVAIDSGMAETVLCLFSDTSSVQDPSYTRGFHGEWTAPLGYLGPVVAFGLLSTRYKHQFGLDEAALGKLAVTQRGHALLNDNACDKLRKPIAIEDYLNSTMISDPIRLLDCVMPCDGANGVLVTSRRRAKSKRFDKFAIPIGYGERTSFQVTESVPDPTVTGHKVAGEKAFAAAGLRPKDISSIQPYDDFVIAIMLQFEMLGFCKHGHGAAFIRDNDFTHTGTLPLNTGGGQISAGQCGLAGGGTNLVEAIRQLFGEGEARQVKNTKNVLATGIGGIPYGRNWTTSTAMILTVDA